MIRFAVLQIIGAALLIAASLQGWIWPLFASDQSRLTYGIAALCLTGLACAARDRRSSALWCAGACVMLGLLGTVVGFKIAFSGVAGEEIAIRDLGMDTALNTTICGMVTSLWLSLTERLR